MDILGGCVVSNTQYASLVSATTTSFHLISRCLSVLSQSGGLGKLCTFSFFLELVAEVSVLEPGLLPEAEPDMIARVSEWRRFRDLCMWLGVVVLGLFGNAEGLT